MSDASAVCDEKGRNGAHPDHPDEPAALPLRWALLLVGIDSLFTWAYLKFDLFDSADASWFEFAVSRLLPFAAFAAMLAVCVSASRSLKGRFLQMIGCKMPDGKGLQYTIAMTAFVLLGCPAIVLLPHWWPSLRPFYEFYEIFPEESRSFIEHCVKTGRHDYIYFFLPQFAAVVVLGPITEEVLFRGVLFRSMLQRWSPTKAGLFSTAIFVVMHTGAVPDISGLAGPVLIGAGACYIFHETKCLWVAIFLHLMVNAEVFAFGLGKIIPW